jgi:hypothetical protein
MDVLWFILVVLVWLACLKWVGPRFKLTGCGPGKCAGPPHPPGVPPAATPGVSPDRAVEPTSAEPPLRP